MKEILKSISNLSYKIGEQPNKIYGSHIENPWLGFDSVNNQYISEFEKKLNIIFPDDYKKFLNITNGFTAPVSVEPTFLKIQEIDYLKNVDQATIEAYQMPELEDSIIIAGKEEEQYFLLIPPSNHSGKWKYWKFANWMTGEQEFENLENYFLDVLRFIEEEYEDKENNRQ